jgi:hypothetical protein
VSPAFASRARAAIPAARGADADVPNIHMEFSYIQYYSLLFLTLGNTNMSEQLLHFFTSCSKFYVISTVHFGMKLYNDQCNAQAFNLFIYLLLPYMFQAFF